MHERTMPSAAKMVISMSRPPDITRGVIFSEMESAGGSLSVRAQNNDDFSDSGLTGDQEP